MLFIRTIFLYKITTTITTCFYGEHRSQNNLQHILIEKKNRILFNTPVLSVYVIYLF